MPEKQEPPSERERVWPLALVQREVILVVVLAIIAAVAFGATRSLAEWSRDRARQQAAEAFAEGRARREAGDFAGAVAALRRAVAHDRLNGTYVLTLVRVLTDAGQDDEARMLLLRLREREPDRPEINYRLARLAARRGDTAEATRYYNHAMYGLTSDDPRYDRRRVRLELATFLLDQGEREEALVELFALGREVPDTAGERVELARLFLRAGDPRSALAQFTAAVQADPASGYAAVGAGEAAFALGLFQQAERHLQNALRLGVESEPVRARLETTRLARSISPLSSGLVSAERVRRLRAGLRWAAGRLRGCTEPTRDDPLVAEIEAYGQRPTSDLRESGAIDGGVDLMLRAVAAMADRCPERDPAEAAWRAIGGARRAGAE